MNIIGIQTSSYDQTPEDSFTHQKLIHYILLAMLAITFLRPLHSSEFWWHSARGATVLNGNICPSTVMLANETANDADWLAGLIPILVWELGGILGVSIYPVIVFLICLFICHYQLRFRRAEEIVVFGSLLSLFSFAWMQPIPQSLELILTIVLFNVLTQTGDKSGSNKKHLFWLLMCWANLGAHILVPYILVCVSILFEGRLWKEKLRFLLLMTLAISMTPRGLLTAWDSLHLVTPWLFSSDRLMLLSHQSSNTDHTPMLIQQAFLIFALIPVCMGLWCKITTRDYVSCLLLISISVMNPNLISIAVVWIGLIICNALQKQSKQTNYLIAVASLVCLIGFHAANRTPIGVVGLNPRLDHRLLLDGLPEMIESEVAWCDSTHAGGLYCYASEAGRCWDIPIRAQICGRLHELDLFRRDLIRNRESRYRRPDGTWGGWWVTAENRGIEILLVDSEETELHESLQLTEWKPTDIDSPIIPYVKASNVAHQQELIRCLQAQDIVSFTDWSFNIDQYSTSQPYIAFHWTGAEKLSKSAVLRQARLFNGLGLHVASLKVLLALRNDFDPAEFESDVRLCHRGLASREWSEVGLNSLFHQWIGHGETLVEFEPDRKGMFFDDDFEADYLAGNLNKCLQRHATTAQENFALAMIALEASNVTGAIQYWQAAIQTEPSDSSIDRLSKHWLKLFDVGAES
ncbi:MAG: hypothetical protein CMN21_21590 [Rubinisphaera sp.]|nr:hypothetical protein [Rubinisphaera sp.]|tara:strand:+ start:1749 stop:3821 length:2073 start_codon:yes stop_codon:yes gene_type:complete